MAYHSPIGVLATSSKLISAMRMNKRTKHLIDIQFEQWQQYGNHVLAEGAKRTVRVNQRINQANQRITQVNKRLGNVIDNTHKSVVAHRVMPRQPSILRHIISIIWR